MFVCWDPLEPSPSDPRNTQTPNPQLDTLLLDVAEIALDDELAAVAIAARVPHVALVVLTLTDTNVRPGAVGTAIVSLFSDAPIKARTSPASHDTDADDREAPVTANDASV